MEPRTQHSALGTQHSFYRVDGWCALCGGRIRARDDEMTKVCSHCGALLDVMPQPSGAPTRHIGEAMASVRYSLETPALERALARLRERYEARELALRDRLRMARIRQIWLIATILSFLTGIACLIAGWGTAGALLVFFGFYGLMGQRRLWTGGYLYAHEYEDTQARGDERDAVRAMRALREEILRRERVLDAIRYGRDWT